jgi:hypothetical protein
VLGSMLPLWVRVECAVWDRGRGGRGLVPDVLEGGLILELRRQHLLPDVSAMLGHARTIVIVIIVIVLALTVEIGRAFMFVGSSILWKRSARYLEPRVLPRKPTYWYLVRISPISLLEYSYSFLLLPKMITATSTEHRTDSSCAFLNRPPLRLRKVLHICISILL